MELSILFGVPRKRLQQQMDSEEFAELLAYDRFIEPIGYRRGDIWAAQVTAGIGGGKIADHVLKFQSRLLGPEESEDDIRAAMAKHRAARQQRQQLVRAKRGNSRQSKNQSRSK